MKLQAVRSILQDAQKNECHGNICSVQGCCGSFDFQTYGGTLDVDIISFDEENNIVGLLGCGCNAYYDCSMIAHIDVYPKQ